MRKYISFFAAISLMYYSCLKPPAVTPPYTGHEDPGLDVTGNLRWLNSITPAPGAQPILLDTDITIAAIVRADDRSGNIYDQLILEDSSGGISIYIDSKYLYHVYPEGRKLYLKLKGLYLGNEHGLPCLGSVPAPDNSGALQVSAIPLRQIGQHIIPANFPATMAPTTAGMSDLVPLNPQLLNRLIRIPELQLANPGLDRTYAEAGAARNIRLEDCQGNGIILRTSSYASFRSSATPSGKGSITAIYSVYDSTPQLIIRDTGDLQLLSPRCDGSTTTHSILLPVDSLRRIYKGSDTLIKNLQISGIVITDALSRNHGANGSIIVQDHSGGITVYFGASATTLPLLGDSVRIDLNSSILTRYNGLMEIKNIRTAAVEVLAADRTVIPVLLNIATLNANFKHYESRLVRIDNARITNPGNYSGSRTLKDSSGTIILFTSSAATFATQPAPAISKTYQGIPTWYDTVKEIKIRNPGIDVW